MSVLRVSAPGKTILHGEHAVVYGKAAIAVSVSLRTNIFLENAVLNKIMLNFSDFNISKVWKIPHNVDNENGKNDVILYSEENLIKYYEYFGDIKPTIDNPVSMAQNAFVYLYCAVSERYGNGSCRALNIKVSTEIPIAAGLGSSASYSVALATTLLILYEIIDKNNFQNDKSQELINKWSYECERVIHGQPSGIDNSTCTYGGALLFKNGQICEKIQNLPKISILLVNSNIGRNTKTMVENVRIKQQKYPKILNNIMDSIEHISLHQWEVLKNISHNGLGDTYKSFNELVPINQHLLNAMGVGHEAINKICSIAGEYGQNAKLTGAGGGGCALVFLSKENSDIKMKLKIRLENEGFTVWETELAGPGILIE